VQLSVLKTRVAALLELATKGQTSLPNANQVLEGTLTVVRAAYGDGENRLANIRSSAEAYFKQDPSADYAIIHCMQVCGGVLANLKEEIDAGLLDSLEARVTGDVLSDLVKLARTALEEAGDGARNVGAVLTAAAYEDTLRRLLRKAAIADKEKLADVITSLKDAGFLVGPEVGVAQSHLNFRNRALHAQWDALDRTVINTVLAFVEQLLLKHFA